jgi:hypothetical protein
MSTHDNRDLWIKHKITFANRFWGRGCRVEKKLGIISLKYLEFINQYFGEKINLRCLINMQRRLCSTLFCLTVALAFRTGLMPRGKQRLQCHSLQDHCSPSCPICSCNLLLPSQWGASQREVILEGQERNRNQFQVASKLETKRKPKSFKPKAKWVYYLHVNKSDLEKDCGVREFAEQVPRGPPFRWESWQEGGCHPQVPPSEQFDLHHAKNTAHKKNT